MNERAPLARFGAFELDVRTGELRKHGIRIKLQEQPWQILVLLLERPGEIVTRDQIQKQLWPDGTFVDFDNAINSAVRKLRDALNDTAENPRFVETLARRGYRFVGPVPGPLALPKPELVPAPAAPVVPDHKWRWIAVALVAVMLLAVSAKLLRTGGSGETVNLRVVPLTSNPGLELQPSFSPDGTRVAYAWNGVDGKAFAIYSKLIGAGVPVQITKDGARDFSPAWSPDGRWIAAIRDLGHQNAVILIPASGGQHREVARVNKNRLAVDVCASKNMPRICGLDYGGSLLAWSPDGRYLFTSAAPQPQSPLAIVRISVDTGELYPITSPPSGSSGDLGGTVSADGRNLAFVRWFGGRTGDIYIAPLFGGTPGGQARRVTFDGVDITSLAWTPDAREVIFSSNRTGRRELWRIDVAGSGKPRLTAGMGENAVDVAIAAVGKRLVYSSGTYLGSLWKTPLQGTRAGTPVRVTATTARDKFSHFSPDGKRIAFQSSRSGVDEIWVCDADGANAVQLTNFGRGMSGSPRWSPDGRSIAFDSDIRGNWDIYVIGAAGGGVRRLTNSPLDEAVPSWSRDSRWIYFRSSAPGAEGIWKIHPDGGSETRVANGDGLGAVESVDGKTLYFLRDSDEFSEIWSMPLGGGPATKVLSHAQGRMMTVTQKGIYYGGGSPKTDLRYFDFGTHSIRALTPLGDFAHADVSADEHWVLYPQVGDMAANLMLVENFR